MAADGRGKGLHRQGMDELEHMVKPLADGPRRKLKRREDRDHGELCLQR